MQITVQLKCSEIIEHNVGHQKHWNDNTIPSTDYWSPNIAWAVYEASQFYPQHKKASNHHANLPLEMYSFTL